MDLSLDFPSQLWAPFALSRPPIRCSAGYLIYLQNTEATCFYYLKSGRVKSYIQSADGAERVLNIYPAGSLFGEASFFDKLPRVSSAVALSPCELVPIDRELAAQAVSGDPELALSMMKYLARTVRLLSEQLDAMAPGHPLVIHHKSGHMGLMNSAALSALGITPETPVPPGGKIGVKDRCLTGYLEENAFFTYLKQLPPTPPDQLLSAYARAQEQYAAHGITTIQDGMAVEEMFPMYQMLLDSGILKLDLVVYPSPQAYDAAVERFGALPPERHLRIGGMKVYLDGSPQGRTAWMREPYAGEADYRGYGTMEDAALEEAMELACLRRTQLLCHCNGDGAAEQFLRCLAQVEQKHPEMAQLRPVIIHGQLLAPDQLPRVKELGAVVSFFVAHVYHWGDVHLRNFGPERASRISPARSALELGIPFTFHQDAPVIQPDMLETLWCAANRRTQSGVHLGPEEEIPVLDALRAVTTSAAFQYFRERELGAIAPGMAADFVILDRDPLTVPKEDLREIQVMAACKGGDWVCTKYAR